MNDWSEPLLTLLELQRRCERGPKREGIFALWLTTRVALDIGMAEADAEKAQRRRVALLRQRLTPLAIPRPLSRGLATALTHLDELSPTGARIALTQLVAPAMDVLGSDVAAAVARAARTVHDHQATPRR